MTVTDQSAEIQTVPVGMYTESTTLNVMPGDIQTVMRHMHAFGYVCADDNGMFRASKKSRYRFARIRFTRDIRVLNYDRLSDLSAQYIALLCKRNVYLTERTVGSGPFIAGCTVTSAAFIAILSSQIFEASQSYAELLLFVATCLLLIGTLSCIKSIVSIIYVLHGKFKAHKCLKQMRALADDALTK